MTSRFQISYVHCAGTGVKFLVATDLGLAPPDPRSEYEGGPNAVSSILGNIVIIPPLSTPSPSESFRPEFIGPHLGDPRPDR
jgi:hypothetical protein